LREDLLPFSSENHKITPVEKSLSIGASTIVPTISVSTQGSSSRFRRDWVLGLILILFVILTYTPVWKAGFVWDDETILTANSCIVGPLGLKEIWTTAAADICPLTLTTFWAEHALWGLNPLPYHLVNVLLHGACAILLWRLLRSLRVQGAWLGAVLWALHPVMVESVAWITEMKNTESGLFFLLSILFFVRWINLAVAGYDSEREHGGGSSAPTLPARNASAWVDPSGYSIPPASSTSMSRSTSTMFLKGCLDGRTGDSWSYALSLLFAALAMAAKSSTVILPVVLCLCAWWIEGRWHWRNLARMVPIFLMAIAASALSIWTQRSQLATVTDPQWVRTWPERLATAGDAVWFYLGKLLWPHPLSANYPRWQIDAGQWVSYLPLLALIVILSIFWLRRRSGGAGSRACFLAFTYFIVALLPVLGFIDTYIFQYSLVFDHFQYLAGIGPLALTGTALIIPKKPWLQSALGAGLLLILGIASWQWIWVYTSEDAFWTDMLAKNPNSWMAHNNLGNALFQKGQLDDAVAQYQKALETNPDDAQAHNNLGNALFQKGELDDAVAHYQKALEINPKYAQAHSNLGLALFRKGQLDDAVAHYQKALEINPDDAQAHSNLGLALFQKGQLDDAVAHYQKALETNPNSFEVHSDLGNALFRKGQVNNAVAQYQKALEINPDYARAHGNLGVALFQKGQVDDAVAQYQKALEINPNSFEVHYNLGYALFQKGELDLAITQFQEVLRLKPDFSPAQDNLARAQALVRQREGHK
jgi:tetratricopeptide (TPR) repeat protein